MFCYCWLVYSRRGAYTCPTGCPTREDSKERIQITDLKTFENKLRLRTFLKHIFVFQFFFFHYVDDMYIYLRNRSVLSMFGCSYLIFHNSILIGHLTLGGETFVFCYCWLGYSSYWGGQKCPTECPPREDSQERIQITDLETF